MKYKKLRFASGFHVMFGNRHAQGAEMVIAPGESEGGPGNRHRGADQWLNVVSRNGIAIVGRTRRRLDPATYAERLRAAGLHPKRGTAGGRASLKT
jgi:hypothetical protein